jgi:hypothetical protein
MISRALLVTITVALGACGQAVPQARSLVGDHPVPGNYALAGDTITLWKRRAQPGGGTRLHAYSITPGGLVQFLDEAERSDAPLDPEGAQDAGQGAADGAPRSAAERRLAFTLPAAELEAIRTQAALLRPAAMGPEDPVGGYAGEVRPRGCAADRDPRGPRPLTAGINFLNGANWGAFVLLPDCTSPAGRAADRALSAMFDHLENAMRAAER